MLRREGLKETTRFNVLGRDNRANNRNAQYQLRAKQRMQLHQDGRNILPSPHPAEITRETANEENKENQNENTQIVDKKLAHKQIYLQRFMAWRAQKAAKAAATTKPTTATTEQHIFVLKATPKRKKLETTSTSNSKICKSISQKLNFKTLNNLTAQRNVPTIGREKTMLSIVQNTKKIPATTTVGTTTTTVATRTTTVANTTTTFATITTTVANTTTTVAATTTTVATTTSKVLPKFDCKPAATKIAINAGAAHKIRSMQQKQQNAKPTTTNKAIINKNKLSVAMKPKKPTDTKSAAACIKRLDSQAVKRLKSKKPTDTVSAAAFIKRLDTQPVEKLIVNNNNRAATTVKTNNFIKSKQPKPENNKRNIQKLQIKSDLCVKVEEKLELNTPLDTARFDPTVTSTRNRNGMFDFKAATQATTFLADNVLPSKPRNLSRQYAVDTGFVYDDLPADVSQPNSENEATLRENKFVSTFVSIARGKVSARKERSRRNSMYLNSSAAAEQTMLHAENTLVPEQALQNARALEAVSYFRQQLQNETSRLHKLIADWSAYREQHLMLLERLGVEDMIDAAIGQTNLLTSKKFQQFNGLIARCEAGVTGIGLQPDDGSEATKLITAIDLEGFWSMLQLQVDNIDKRFANLERWKANNWLDPDAVAAPVVAKRKVALTKKAIVKSKTTSSLRDMIRKAQLEKRQKQQNNDGQNNETIKIFTPTRTRLNIMNAANVTNSDKRRQSIVVRDRKQFSQSPTILTLPAGTPRSHKRKSLTGEPNALLRTALMGAANQCNFGTPKLAEHVVTPIRKSILKTPATSNRSALKRRSVSFGFNALLENIKFVTESSDSE